MKTCLPYTSLSHTFKLYKILILFLSISISDYFSDNTNTFPTIWLRLWATSELYNSRTRKLGSVSKILIWHWLRVTPETINSRTPAHLLTVQVCSWLENTLRQRVSGTCSKIPSMCNVNMNAKDIWVVQQELLCCTLRGKCVANSKSKCLLFQTALHITSFVYIPLWACGFFLGSVSKSEITGLWEICGLNFRTLQITLLNSKITLWSCYTNFCFLQQLLEYPLTTFFSTFNIAQCFNFGYLLSKMVC